MYFTKEHVVDPLVESLKTRNDSRGEAGEGVGRYRSCHKHESLSLVTLAPFVRCFVYNKSKVKFKHSCDGTQHYRK